MILHRSDTVIVALRLVGTIPATNKEWCAAGTRVSWYWLTLWLNCMWITHMPPFILKSDNQNYDANWQPPLCSVHLS